MDKFQQAIEESRRNFEANQEKKRKAEEKKQAELKRQKEEELRLKQEMEEQERIEREERERKERETCLQKEYDQLRAQENDKIRQEKETDGQNTEFSQTMKSMFVREGESVQWDVAIEQQDDGPEFIPTMPKDIEEHKRAFAKAQQAAFEKQEQQMEELPEGRPSISTNANALNNLEQLFFQDTLKQSNFDATQQSIHIQNIGKQINQKLDQQPSAHKVKDSQWFSTEKVVDGDESPLKHMNHLDGALNTAPNRFAGLNETQRKEKDLQRNNFMDREPSEHQSIIEKDSLAATHELGGWEQKQLFALEKQQNELQLKLLKMQQELEGNPVETLEPKGAPKIEKEAEQIQQKQEELIRSIVLKSAVFQQDLREYDPEKSLRKKTGAYKEEFIQSICNRSGVFVQEFREIKEDPYAREEFIMSINLRNAEFNKIEEYPRSKEYDIYTRTIAEAKRKTDESQAAKMKEAVAADKLKSKAGDRKNKLVFELEVKDQMRKIQKNQIKQKAKEDQQRLKVGQNLFAQIMGNAPKPMEQPKPVSLKRDDCDDSDFTDDIARGGSEITGTEDLFTADNEDEIDISTGTFGGNKNKHIADSLNKQITQNQKKPRNIQSAVQRDQGKKQAEAKKARPISGVSQLTKKSGLVHTTGISDLTVRSGITSDEPSSLNERGQEKSDIDGKSISIGASRKVPLVDYKEIEGEESYDFDKNLREYEARNNQDGENSAIEELKETEEETMIGDGNDSDGFGDRDDESDDRDDLEDDEEQDSPLKEFTEDGTHIEEQSEKTEEISVNVQTFNQQVAEQTYTESELEAYKKEIEIAIDEQLLRESQAELIVQAMAKRVKGPDDDPVDQGSRTLERTVGDEIDSALFQNHSNLRPTSMSFKAPTDQDKSMNDRDPAFKNDVTMKSESQIKERDFDDQSYQTRSDLSKGGTIPKDAFGNLESQILDDSNGMVQSIHNVTRKEQASPEQEALDPIPKTAGGQARCFYYETEDVNLTVKSKDFDDLYEHGREEQLQDQAEEDESGEMTFGSRPPTAPEKKREQNSPQTPYDPDNSMVQIGQITVDRKNDILGNEFQSPSLNQHHDIPQGRKLDYSTKNQNELKQELLDLQKQNEEVLSKIEKQKKQNLKNLKNLKQDKDYKLEDTYDPKAESDDDLQDYDDNDFEAMGSDDEQQPENQNSKFQLTVQASPKQVKKGEGAPSKYYGGLESKAKDEQNYSEDDALKDFYEMQKTKKEQELIENQEDDFFNQFGAKEKNYDSDYSDEKFSDPLSSGLKKRKSDQEEFIQKQEEQLKKAEQKPKRKAWAMNYDGFTNKKSQSENKVQSDDEYSDNNDGPSYPTTFQDTAKQEKTNESPAFITATPELDEKDEPEEPPSKAPVVLDFNDDAGETIRQQKMKRFEEFKQRREMQEAQRKQKRALSKGHEADDQSPQTEQIQINKAKAKDIQQPGQMPPKPVNRTPAPRLAEKHQPKGFKGLIPKASPSAKVINPRQNSNSRQQSGSRLYNQSPQNWMNEKNQGKPKLQSRQGSAQRDFEEESKYDHEAQEFGTRLPPLQTPSETPQSIRSTKAPTIAPRVAMEKNSNKKILKNAIQLVVLAGQNEQTKREREEVLEVIDSTSYSQYVILFKQSTGRFDMRALYARTGSESEGQLTRIYGPQSSLSPSIIEDSQIEKFYKYSSGQRNFNEIGGQKSLTPTTDAVVLRKVKKSII